MEVCVPIKFTKKTNKAQAIDDEMIPVNNFFGHWFTDLDIRRYPDDMLILPTNNSVSIVNICLHNLWKNLQKLCYILIRQFI